ncbi:hypothetical protein ES702_01261 [subsurface metagenome]
MAIQNPKTEWSKRKKFKKPDECYTPEYAIRPLLPYLHKKGIIWDCAFGSGKLAKHFKKKGFKVIGNKSHNFLENGFPKKDFDCIVTNPPYSLKLEFLRCAYAYGKPFALLLPLTALEGKKRGELYKKYGIQLIIPNRRIHFEIPSGKKSSWFATAWFCWKLNLPKDLMFVELNHTGG